MEVSPSPPPADEQSLLDWLLDPRTLISFSAVLLSVCGLFISIYETSLIRQQQRAAVWPRVEVGPSLSDSSFAIRARNVGVGPARVRSAALRHRGAYVSGWPALLRAVGLAPEQVALQTNLLNGRVLKPAEESTLIGVTQSQLYK